MPGPRTPCDPSQLTPVIEKALKNAKISKNVAQDILNEVGATETISGWVGYARTDALASTVFTEFVVQQYSEGHYDKQATFPCPPNPPQFEAELKRAHSLGLLVIAVYTLQKDGKGLISSLLVHPPFMSEPPWKNL